MVTHEYRHGNAIIKVYRPDLSEKELEKRKETILIALQQVGKAMEDSKWQR